MSRSCKNETADLAKENSILRIPICNRLNFTKLAGSKDLPTLPRNFYIFAREQENTTNTKKENCSPWHPCTLVRGQKGQCTIRLVHRMLTPRYRLLGARNHGPGDDASPSLRLLYRKKQEKVICLAHVKRIPRVMQKTNMQPLELLHNLQDRRICRGFPASTNQTRKNKNCTPSHPCTLARGQESQCTILLAHRMQTPGILSSRTTTSPEDDASRSLRLLYRKKGTAR